MIRLGLCCLFKNEPVKFRHATAAQIRKLDRQVQIAKLSELCLHNSQTLLLAVETCNRLGIKSFRVMTPLFPLYTHPEAGYELSQLPDKKSIIANFAKIRKYKHDHGIRLSFHPDQFIVLNSPRNDVVENAIAELAYQTLLAQAIDADVINIHLGGVYGDKNSAVKRFIDYFTILPEEIQQRLTIENDDKSYSPADIIPVVEKLGIPFVYDVHHHRCHTDDMSVKQATDICISIWQNLNREPYFHISSPKNGWGNGKPQPHADYIDIHDFPDYWLNLKSDFTLDIEAKAKELAVLRLIKGFSLI